MSKDRELLQEALDVQKALVKMLRESPLQQREYVDLGIQLNASIDHIDARLAEPQESLTGCACRWDSEDNRVATCVRHQGWLDVVSEWAERAKAAEAKLAQPHGDAGIMQLPPLTDVMYHAVRGSEYHFTGGGDSAVAGYLNDDCLDEIWDSINTALRCAGVPAIRAEGTQGALKTGDVVCAPTDEQCDAVRGILQYIRMTNGAQLAKLREHCKMRGDDLSKWPKWAQTDFGYVTESAAASLIYSVMLAASQRKEG